jgi:DNA-binding LytR/AlgR family response regulator
MVTKCVIVEDEIIARDVIKNYLSKINNFELVAEFKKPTEAITFLNSYKVDLIFLDINLPEINGIEFAKSLINAPYIIFTTAYREFAAEGFEVHAIDYLVKPFSFERFLKAINHYLNISKKELNSLLPEKPVNEETEFVLLKDGKKTYKVTLKEINYIESDGDYIRFFLHETKIMVRGCISSWEKILPRNQFVRIHNSYIISINKISYFTSYSVEIGNKNLPISRSHRKDVLSILQGKKD